MAKTEKQRGVFKGLAIKTHALAIYPGQGNNRGGRPDLRDALAGAVRAYLAAAPVECSAATLAAKNER